MFKKPKIKVQGSSIELDTLPTPVKSTKFFPDWYKKLKRTDLKGLGSATGGTVKRCIPFREAMGAGITIPLWADICINVYQIYHMYDTDGEYIGDHEDVNQDGADYLVGKIHDQTGKTVGSYKKGDVNFQMTFHHNFETDAGHEAYGRHDTGQIGGLADHLYCKTVLKLHSPWVISTPKGWSAYYKPYPNSVCDLRIFEGLVDIDTYRTWVNFPFYWAGRETGTFIIKKGTPIAQVLFIKRDMPDIEYSKVDYEETIRVDKLLHTSIQDSYLLNFWHKRKER